MHNLRHKLHSMNQMLTEMFDFNNIKPFKYITTGGDYKFTGMFTFNVNNEQYQANVEIDKDPSLSKYLPTELRNYNNIITIAFTINDNDAQEVKLSTSMLVRIFKTVIDISNKYFDKYHPEAIFYASTHKSGKDIDDNQKMLIYQTLTIKYIPENYSYGFSNFENRKWLMIFKTK